MRTTSMVRVAAIAAAVVTASLTSATAAGATTDEIHCSTTVIGQEESGEFILDDIECFADQESALAAIEESTASRGESAAAVSIQSTLAVHFDGANYTGSSLTISGVNCGGGYTNLTGFWDNRVSSTLGVCPRVRHWSSANATGFYQDTLSSGNLTSLNNISTSIQYLT